MIVEILYIDDCPSHRQLLPTVRRLAEQAGAELRQRRITTRRQAERERFLGSPTVRVNGLDVEPGAAERSDYGLKCRIYRPSALPPSPTPPRDWIEAALARNWA